VAVFGLATRRPRNGGESLHNSSFCRSHDCNKPILIGREIQRSPRTAGTVVFACSNDAVVVSIFVFVFVFVLVLVLSMEVRSHSIRTLNCPPSPQKPMVAQVTHVSSSRSSRSFPHSCLSGGVASSKASSRLPRRFVSYCGAPFGTGDLSADLLPQFRFTNVLTNEASKTPRTVGTYLRDREAQRLRSILENFEIEGLATSWYLGKVLVKEPSKISQEGGLSTLAKKRYN
jgi:hypothetical protein